MTSSTSGIEVKLAVRREEVPQGVSSSALRTHALSSTSHDAGSSLRLRMLWPFGSRKILCNLVI